MNRHHINSYYHPNSTQRLLEAITIVVILDQELLRVHGVSLPILTLDGNIVMYQSVVRSLIKLTHHIIKVMLVVWPVHFEPVQCLHKCKKVIIKIFFIVTGYLMIINMI